MKVRLRGLIKLKMVKNNQGEVEMKEQLDEAKIIRTIKTQMRIILVKENKIISRNKRFTCRLISCVLKVIGRKRRKATGHRVSSTQFLAGHNTPSCTCKTLP